MKLYVCSVFDKAVEAFMPPVFFRARGEAVRSFSDAVRKNEQFNANPEHYSFMLIGTFDDNLGQFENVSPPELLLLALNVPSSPFPPQLGG